MDLHFAATPPAGGAAMKSMAPFALRKSERACPLLDRQRFAAERLVVCLQ
jgi:hypothetical protein